VLVVIAVEIVIDRLTADTTASSVDRMQRAAVLGVGGFMGVIAADSPTS